MTEITVENITPEVYTDDFIVDCARVSYAKRADQFTPEQNKKLLKYLFNPPDSVPHWAPFAGPRICFLIYQNAEEWLEFFNQANLTGFSGLFTGTKRTGQGEAYLEYELSGSLWAWHENLAYFHHLVRWDLSYWLSEQFPIAWEDVMGHSSANLGERTWAEPVVPLDESTRYYNLRIKAPIFVARQLIKHQKEMVWSETSRRYIKSSPELWWPEEFHKAPTHSKQGASDELFDFSELSLPLMVDNPQITDCRINHDWKALWQSYAHEAVSAYNEAVKAGMAPEEARMILPQNMMTEWIWTGSQRAFRRVLRERLAPGAQKSGTRETAEKIKIALGWQLC